MSKKGKIEVKTGNKSEFSESKLAELLGGLTKEEYKKFGLFIKSPYFNKSKTLEKLYDYFKPRMENLGDPKITKENISQHINPGEKFDDANVRKQLSNFSKIIEEFLILYALEKKTFTKGNLLIMESLKRGYVKTVEQTITELRKAYGNTAVMDSEYYYNLHDTERSYFLFKSKEMKNPEEHTNKTSFILDLHYISVKLLHYYTMLNLKLHYNKQVEFDSWAFDDIVKFIEKHKPNLSANHKSLFADYLSIKMMLSPDNATPFNELKEYVRMNKDKVGDIEKHRMYIYMYNHSLYRFNRGYSQSPGEVFGVIKEMESDEVPLWHYFAYHMYYINAVKYASMTKEYKWADDFMIRRKEKVHDNIREETFSLARAHYYFSKDDYNNALKYLVNVDYPNYSFYLNAKTMLVKIYWERSEQEGVISTIDAMRKFLQRKELIPQRLHESYTNFINCVSKMIDADSKDKTYEIRKLMEKEMIAADKNWITDKLKQIEK